MVTNKGLLRLHHSQIGEGLKSGEEVNRKGGDLVVAKSPGKGRRPWQWNINDGVTAGEQHVCFISATQ